MHQNQLDRHLHDFIPLYCCTHKVRPDKAVCEIKQDETPLTRCAWALSAGGFAGSRPRSVKTEQGAIVSSVFASEHTVETTTAWGLTRDLIIGSERKGMKKKNKIEWFGKVNRFDVVLRNEPRKPGVCVWARSRVGSMIHT